MSHETYFMPLETRNISTKIKQMKNKKYYLIVSYMCGIFIALFIYWLYKEGKTTEKLLLENGVETKGVIVGKYRRKRGIEYKFNFSSEGNIYTGWFKNKNKFYVNDSIQILYYKGNPERYYKVLLTSP